MLATQSETTYPLKPMPSINDYVVTPDHYRPLDDVQLKSLLCQEHVNLFEKAVGLSLQDFLCNPDRLHIALTKAVPISLGITGMMDGRAYDWLDVRCFYVGIDSDVWIATPYELKVQEQLMHIIHLWMEFGCWGEIDVNDSDIVTKIKQECFHDYTQLLSASKRF
jgi:hypothetical protein